MRAVSTVALGLFLATGLGPGTHFALAAEDPFPARVVPFVKRYCAECHNGKRAEAELNLVRFDTGASAAGDFRQWEQVLVFLERKEMPPASAKEQPSDELRAEILKTIRSTLAVEARKVAGDPGVVLPRRLSNAEYDHTVRDLIGHDVRATKTFPVDPAAGEGFNNTGEALAMSPALFNRLYGAAQHVADHALLTTRGLEFAPYPVATFADRQKFYEQQILEFYDRHRIDYEKVFTICWEYRHRPAAHKDATIAAWAAERGQSPQYVAELWKLLQDEPPEALRSDAYYVGWLRQRWCTIPGPNAPDVQREIQRLADEVRRLSAQLCPKETEAIVAHAGNAPIDHLARRRKTAAERNTFDPKSISASRRLHREYRNLDKQETIRVVLDLAHIGVANRPKTGDGATDANGANGDVKKEPAPARVALRSVVFSTSNPQNFRPNDDKQNTPLAKALPEPALAELREKQRDVRPEGTPENDATLFLVEGKPIAFDVPAAAFAGRKEIHLHVDAELMTKDAGLVTVLLSDQPRADIAAPAAPDPRHLLVSPDHPAAAQITASGAAFCRLFPNRFYFVDDTRGLSSGFHLIEGFFRDDQPLCRLVLSDDENQHLNRLWTELEFVTGITEKLLRGFVFFERSERNFLKHADFDPFKEEDPKLVEPETLARFERVYLDRSTVKAPVEELADHPIHIFFEQIRAGLKDRAERLARAEPVYLEGVERFARKAYRRPLTNDETESLRKFYRDVAAQPEFGLEQAVRASLTRVLMSPHFHCRIDPAPAGDTVQPLPDRALASRLSYFLWSSMPDDELLRLAESGTLHEEKTLREQIRRMLKDPRGTDFAREFFGQWLGYRDFREQESVDRTVFKEFDDALRESMFEEPTRLASHLLREDLPLTGLLDADVTFVDRRLAKFYSVPFPTGDAQANGNDDGWVKVDGLRAQGRGGILGMAVFLTKHAQPQRTSPVKRGFWLVHKVLGEHIPAPPADIVALPAKETDTNGKTIRQLLAAHVEDVKCARCHVRFDAVGLAMEGFDPIGRRRTKDLAGRPVDDVVTLPDGDQARGVPEFARHLASDRRDDFRRTLCRKLLGYALGRSLLLSDDPLLEEMQSVLAKHDDRPAPLIETIVLSPQFRTQRCRDFTAARFRSGPP